MNTPIDSGENADDEDDEIEDDVDVDDESEEEDEGDSEEEKDEDTEEDTGEDTGQDTGNDTGQNTGGAPDTSSWGPNSIAYTGCSMAYNVGTGYGRVGDQLMWNSDGYQTGAKVVQNWVTGGDGWGLFDSKMNQSGGKDVVKAVMVQICIFSSRATDAELHDMISQVRAHTNPGTHIFIVGQPQYNQGHTCTLAGSSGAEWTDQKAQELANDPSINENMTYLGKFMLDNNAGEVMTDTCHATSSGEDVMGHQAIDFFGG